MPTFRLLDTPVEIRKMIFDEALCPSNRIVKIVIKTNEEGSAEWNQLNLFCGLMSACRQLRDEARPSLNKGIILDIKNDENHDVSIDQIVPSQASRDMITAVFYDLPEPEYEHDNTFPLLNSILTLPNLHTVGFKNSHIFGYHHEQDSEICSWDEIRDHELDAQAQGRYTKLDLQWPEYNDHGLVTHDILVLDDLFATRQDVCIVLPYTVTGGVGCTNNCKEQTCQDPQVVSGPGYGPRDEEDSENDDGEDYWSQCDCYDQTEWEAIGIREPNSTTWRFIDEPRALSSGGFRAVTEAEVFARVLALE